jgi:hypothetical protein
MTLQHDHGPYNFNKIKDIWPGITQLSLLDYCARITSYNRSFDYEYHETCNRISNSIARRCPYRDIKLCYQERMNE